MSKSRSLVFGLSTLLLSGGYLIAQQDEPYSKPRAENPTQSSRENVTGDASNANQGAGAAATAPANDTNAPAATAPRREANRNDRNTSNAQGDASNRDNLSEQNRNQQATDRQNAERLNQDSQTYRDETQRNRNDAQRNDQQNRDRDHQAHDMRGQQQFNGQQQWGTIPADPDQAALGVWIMDGQRIRVVGTTPDSPAAQSGIQAGDHILSVGGKQFGSAADLIRGLGEMDVNQNVDVEFMRNGQMFATSLQLGKRAEVFGNSNMQANNRMMQGNAQPYIAQSGQPYSAMRPATDGNSAEMQQLRAEVNSLKQQVHQLRQQIQQHHGDDAAIDESRSENRTQGDERALFPNDRFTPPGPPAPPETNERSENLRDRSDEGKSNRNARDNSERTNDRNDSRDGDDAGDSRNTTLPPPDLSEDAIEATPESDQPRD